jgi:tetratricopeptide (TPR) repeat protein
MEQGGTSDRDFVTSRYLPTYRSNSMTNQELLRRALDFHQRGEFVDAERTCHEVLRAEPINFAARHLLGIVLAHQHRDVEALEWIEAALELRPQAPSALANRSGILRALGRPDEALADIELALTISPKNALAWNKRGNALRDLGRLEKALASYGSALELQSDYAEAFNNRGTVLRDLRRAEEALQDYDRALALRPDAAETHYNRANALQDLGRLREAVEAYDHALALRDIYAEAHFNRANALRDLDRVDDAIASYNRAIALDPAFAEAHNNRSNLLRDLGYPEEALAGYDRAIAGNPGYSNARLNKGLTALLLGRFAEGWPLYEWRTRKRANQVEVLVRDKPQWPGHENIAGQTLLIYAEQGFGDTIQFCRYARIALALGARIILAVQDPLVRLMKSMAPDILVTGWATVPAHFDRHSFLLSMPRAFGTVAETVPGDIPYLRAEPERIQYWKERIGIEGFKVGIAWQGNIHSPADAGRSFPLAASAGLAAIPGVRLISLQKNEGTEQLHSLPAGMRVEALGEDFDAGPDAFVDTAAVMESLDLVVTLDSAIAHLAGALGRPAWLALQFVPDWRWQLDRSDSPWYPTMRLFRQKARGDWQSVFTAMEEALRKTAHFR